MALIFFFTIRLFFLNLLNTRSHISRIALHICTSDEEIASIILLTELVLVLTHESHLLMVRGSEHFLCLRLLRELSRKDLAFDVSVGTDVRDRQGNSLAHDFRVQVVTFDLFLWFA